MKTNDAPSPRSGAVPVPSVGPRLGNPVPPRFESLAAFLERTKDLPDLSWLIEEVVPDSGNLLVVAAPGVGKTFLAFVIAKTAAEAGRPVFMVLEEGRPRSIYGRFTDLRFPPDAPVYIAHRTGMRLDDKAVREELAEHLRDHEAPVLILDPFSSLFLGDENDTRAVNQAKEHIQALASLNPRALVVLLHHTSKAGERGDGPAIYAARGSTVLPGWADVQVNLTREDTPRHSGLIAFVAQVAKGRDGETAQRYRFTISRGDGTVTREDVSDEAAPDKVEKVRQAIASASIPPNKTEIAKIVRGRRQDVFRVIDSMEERGEIMREGSGYVLAPQTTSEQGG